jgi:hypothetical protein
MLVKLGKNLCMCKSFIMNELQPLIPVYGYIV